MKAKDIEIGGRYIAKVSGKLVTVRVKTTSTMPLSGRRYWYCTNESTGREIVVKSAQRFRHVVEQKGGA